MSGLTKFFYNDMKGAPTLKAEWGSLLNVIRAVAINGFNEQGIDSILIVDGVATITFPVAHGFIEHQVIAVSGANEVSFNGEYRLTSITETTVTFNTSFTDVVTGTILVKTAGMGWTEKFSGENKAVFTAKDTVKNPFYLRVDNSCPVGYDTTWAKFARVTISNGINDIDNYDGFEKAPTSLQYPDINENGNGVTGENGIFGWAKWYHGAQTHPNLVENLTAYGQSDFHQYEIVGDGSSIYLNIRITDYDGRALYVFTPFNKTGLIDTGNCFLSASDSLLRANQPAQSYTITGRNITGCVWESNNYTGKYILSKNTVDGTHAAASVFSLNNNNNKQISGYSDNLPSPNATNNSIIISDIYIKEDSVGIRGTLPIIKWINNRWSHPNKIILRDNNILFLVLGIENIELGLSSFYVYQLE